MENMISYAVNNGFAITVAIYLLYERSKFNVKISDSLKEIAVVIKTICKEKA